MSGLLPSSQFLAAAWGILVGLNKCLYLSGQVPFLMRFIMQRQALHLTKQGIFIAHWAIELMAGILIVLIVSPLRGRSVWGGGAGYRYVGPLGLNSQAAIESCYTHRGQRFGCRLYCHCPTLALVG
ncbi:MAG: hypothetical protein ACK5E3_03870 [Planctomycetota bacterium]